MDASLWMPYVHSSWMCRPFIGHGRAGPSSVSMHRRMGKVTPMSYLHSTRAEQCSLPAESCFGFRGAANGRQSLGLLQLVGSRTRWRVLSAFSSMEHVPSFPFDDAHCRPYQCIRCCLLFLMKYSNALSTPPLTPSPPPNDSTSTSSSSQSARIVSRA